MLIKENLSTKRIEDKMNFKFKDLELIGYGSLHRYFNMFYKILLYKYEDKFLIFKTLNENNIHSITKVTNIQKRRSHIFSSFMIYNDMYNYDEEEEIYASEHNGMVEYIFFDKYKQRHDWKMIRKDYLKVSNEEMVMLKLTGEFLDEKKLRWKHYTNRFFNDSKI